MLRFMYFNLQQQKIQDLQLKKKKYLHLVSEFLVYRLVVVWNKPTHPSQKSAPQGS